MLEEVHTRTDTRTHAHTTGRWRRGRVHGVRSLYVSERHSLMVLSFSSAADAMMFSLGWHAVHSTTSVWPDSFCTISLVCRFQMYTWLSSEPDTIHYGGAEFKRSVSVQRLTPILFGST